MLPNSTKLEKNMRQMANMDQIDPAARFANTERARGGSEPLTCTRSDLNDLNVSKRTNLVAEMGKNGRGAVIYLYTYIISLP
jgi:hypothetical protein